MKTSSSSSIPGAGRAHEGITGRGFRTLLVSLGPCGARRPSSRMGQVIFVPDADAWGSPLTSFSFLASDGEADSSPATVTAHVVLPPRPSLMSAPSGITTNGAFSLSCTGSSNAAYRVWVSTNLLDWEPLGLAQPLGNGGFQFLDSNAANDSRRFYRAGAP